MHDRFERTRVAQREDVASFAINCENRGFNEKCIRNHFYGAYQAERFSGNTYFAIWVYHFISPVTEDGLVKGFAEACILSATKSCSPRILSEINPAKSY